MLKPEYKKYSSRKKIMKQYKTFHDVIRMK